MISASIRPRLRSKRRLRAEDVDFPLACVQGLVVRGYNMTFTRYLALNVTDVARARAFIGSIVPSITNAYPWQPGAKPASCLNVAFTYRGLANLKIDPAALNSFWVPGWGQTDHQPFVEGSVAHAQVVGDSGNSAPANWRIDDRAFDVMLIVNASNPGVFEQTAAAVQAQAEASGFTTAGTFDSQQFALPNQNAIYFGYQDGIAEPIIPGIPRDPDGSQDPVDQGWFVLGTATGPAQSVPVPQSPLGDYGCFASFRIMLQDLAAFEQFITSNVAAFMEQFTITKEDVGRAALMAVLVGRWPNGQPLVRHPIDGDNVPPPVLDPTEVNDFQYDPMEGYPPGPTDPNGTACPFGAHVRRANPRDDAPSPAAYHRIMRRANPYQIPYDPANRTSGEVGLMGLFMCTSLTYQFEFIMNSWINGTDTLPASNPPNDMADPILGNHPPNDTLTVLAANGNPWEIPISDFIYTRGSAYVFLPGLDAIRWIANPNDPNIGSCVVPGGAG
jgi:deferrochelatase/peroxidase EfeB